MTPADRASWERDGYVVLREFVPESICRAQWDRAVDLARREARGQSIAPAYVLKEPRLRAPDRAPEEQVSKIFKLHREFEEFRTFSREPRLLGRVQEQLGPDVDCFLSQFIFKFRGSLGQPWHQDSWYFPFDRSPQVGAWLAITEATETNGPLWVLPGSHVEPVHDVVPDRRPDASIGYVEIVDHDMSGAVPVLMRPGDLLVFHSHLMHRSTDHESGAVRAAMVFHYAEAGTVDRTHDRWGFESPNNDFVPVLRGGRAA